MNLKKIIKTFYMVYTVYILLAVDVTNMNLINTLPAIFIMWIIYAFFSLGYREEEKHGKIKETEQLVEPLEPPWLIVQKKGILLLIALLSILFSILAANYYTGQTPMSILNGLISGTSLYYEYQEHFSIQQISTFSLAKLPYVLMLFYIKIVLFYSYIAYFLSKQKMKLYDILYLVCITLSHVYFGVARGTNFETFELVILIIFVLLLRAKNKKRLFKNLLFSFIVGVLMIVIYYNVVTARGFSFGYNISKDIYYDPRGMLPFFFPAFSFIIVMLFDYLGFGFFYIGTLVNDVWITSFSDFFKGLMPGGFKTANNTGILQIMKSYIDMGSRWTPDTALIINNFGFVGLLIICFLLGSFAKKSYKKDKKTLFYLSNFIILIEMISLPIGNFLFVSSASMLIIVTLMSIWIWKYFVRLKITL